MTDERLLRFARELEAEDGELARSIAEVSAVALEVDELRSEAEALSVFLAELPQTQHDVGEALREAEAELERRRGETAHAEVALREAEGRPDDREALAAARRELTRTGDAASSAQRRAERARAASDELVAAAAAAEGSAPALETRGQELAARVGSLPRAKNVGEPEAGLAGAAAWAARVRGALLLTRSALESERERVVRQANELLASVSGEPAPAASVALVRERLEAHG